MVNISKKKKLAFIIAPAALLIAVTAAVFALSRNAPPEPAAAEPIRDAKPAAPSPPPEPAAAEPEKTPPEPETPAKAAPVNPGEVGLKVNNLTGLLVDESVALRRPVAVSINNMVKSLPQSGIAKADIYYEVLAEGGISRIIMFFKEFSQGKIGTVRSARDYFYDFVLDHNAVLVHIGGSDGAYGFVKTNKNDDLDGMRDAKLFFRDKERLKNISMTEHSAYTTYEMIADALARKGYETRLEEQPVFFDFYAEFTAPENATPVKSVTVPFSQSQKGEFAYNEAKGVFLRSQNGNPHIDEETGEQLSVKNIIVQFAKMSVIDSYGRLKVDLVADKGDGYLITAGSCAPIFWEKKSHSSPTLFYDTNGERVKINKGKTWICAVGTSVKLKFDE